MLLALALSLGAPLLAAADCTGSVNGTAFNLTALTDTFHDYIGASGTNLPNLVMTLNPCAPVTVATSAACSAAACCVAETGATDAGSANLTWASCGSETPAAWSALPPDLGAGNVTGVLQTYGTSARRSPVRDVDTPCTAYTSQIAFICAQDANSTVPVLATDFASMLRSECVLSFEWATMHACTDDAASAARVLPGAGRQAIAAK